MTRLLAFALLVALAGCSRPTAPDTDKPVEPQSATRADDLQRAIDAPLDKARDARAALDAAAAARARAAEALDATDPAN
ncbi:hypothetical protein [Lysobacter humi (ex Lee et al. 2017)]